MRVGVFADSHDHLEHIRQAVSLFNEKRCELVLFAGDLISTICVPPLRKLRCPVVAAYGDNEGNRVGLQSGFSIVGTLSDPPVLHEAQDGTRFVIVHMLRQLRGFDLEFDIAIYGHSHRPRVHHDSFGRLFINPGETGGWSFGNPTVALLETATNHVEILPLIDRDSGE